MDLLPRSRSSEALKGSYLGKAAPVAIAIALTWSIPATAWAATWSHFATCGDTGAERLYTYDASSVRRGPGQVRVLVRADYARIPGSRARDARMVWSLDCARRTMVEKSRTEYAQNGRVIARYRATGELGVNPGSVAEKLFTRVCA